MPLVCEAPAGEAESGHSKEAVATVYQKHRSLRSRKAMYRD